MLRRRSQHEHTCMLYVHTIPYIHACVQVESLSEANKSARREMDSLTFELQEERREGARRAMEGERVRDEMAAELQAVCMYVCM